MRLSECPVRVPIRLTEIPMPRHNLLRLYELGLRVGTEMQVTQRAGFGGLVLNIAGSRIAVDHKSAKTIQAEIIV